MRSKDKYRATSLSLTSLTHLKAKLLVWEKKKSAFIVSLGTQLIMPEMKPLSNANLVSKQSMGGCGKGTGCPHFGLFGKTRGSNKGPRHKVEPQLIFLC